MEWINYLFKIDKLPFKIVSLYAICSGILLFSPEVLLEKLFLQKIMEEFGQYVGLTFLVSVGLVAINVVIWVVRKISDKILYLMRQRERDSYLQNLLPSEKSLIREFFIQSARTINLPLEDSTVIELVNKGILFQAGNYGRFRNRGAYFPFTLCDAVRKKIRPSMIGFPIGRPTEEDIERLKNSRPSYIRREELIKSLLTFPELYD